MFDWQVLPNKFPWLSRLSPEAFKSPNEPLWVVELGLWRTIYKGRFRNRVAAASFFSDGQAFFLETLPVANENNQIATQQAIVNLKTGEYTEKVPNIGNPFKETVHMFATLDRVLLAVRYEVDPYQGESLYQVEVPNYHAIKRVPYATTDRITPLTQTPLCFSSDRSTVAYSFDNIIVCRLTGDLKVSWTKQINSRLKVHRLAISADGLYLAAAIADNAEAFKQLEYYVLIYDGKTGRTVTRLPISGTDGIALSPDGKTIAAGKVVYGKNGDASPTVYLYDIASGHMICTQVHDTFKNGQDQWLVSSFGIHGIQFSSDGQYLITSGKRTKVWRFSAAS